MLLKGFHCFSTEYMNQLIVGIGESRPIFYAICPPLRSLQFCELSLSLHPTYSNEIYPPSTLYIRAGLFLCVINSFLLFLPSCWDRLFLCRVERERKWQADLQLIVFTHIVYDQIQFSGTREKLNLYGRGGRQSYISIPISFEPSFSQCCCALDRVLLKSLQMIYSMPFIFLYYSLSSF